HDDQFGFVGCDLRRRDSLDSRLRRTLSRLAPASFYLRFIPQVSPTIRSHAGGHKSEFRWPSGAAVYTLSIDPKGQSLQEPCTSTRRFRVASFKPCSVFSPWSS